MSAPHAADYCTLCIVKKRGPGYETLPLRPAGNSSRTLAFQSATSVPESFRFFFFHCFIGLAPGHVAHRE
jgi:hypothetical protein